MTMEGSRSLRMSRRQAVTLLGVGAGLGLFSAARPAARLLAAPRQGAASGARQVTFPRGAIIRTILKDLPPEALANGTTLFHEHLDGVYSRDTRQLKLPPPSSADITPVIADIKETMRFVNELQAAGVSDAMLHTIQVDNPRRFLAFVPTRVVGRID